HEVMSRISADLEPTPLPMIQPNEVVPSPGVTPGGVPTAPSFPGQVFDATGGGAQAPVPQQPQQQQGQSLGDILLGILNGGN
ncbi:MAG: hypothetical protein WAT77_00720, partial [Paracoccaceae bacterium]